MRIFRYRALFIPAAVFLVGVGMQGTGVPLELALGAYALAFLLVVGWLYGQFRKRPAHTAHRTAGLTPPERLAEPDVAPDAIRQLEDVRARLSDGDLDPASPDVAYALQRAHIALYGAGRRVVDSPVYLPQLGSVDLIVPRLDALIERLRQGVS